MKNKILLPSILIMLSACTNSSTKNQQGTLSDSTTMQSPNSTQDFSIDTTLLKSGATFYQCGMDLEVLSDKPGNCPKCGMELSEMKKF